MSEWKILAKKTAHGDAYVRAVAGRANLTLSVSAFRYLGEKVQVLTNGSAFRIQSCEPSDFGARSLNRIGLNGRSSTLSCAELTALLPKGVRIPVTVHDDYIEGQIPEAQA
jgi:hypothetical protein